MNHAVSPAFRRASTAGLTAAVLVLVNGCGGQSARTGKGPGGDEVHAEAPVTDGYPLASSGPNGYSTTLAGGVTFGNGTLILQNLSNRDLRITKIRPRTTGSLIYLGAQVAGLPAPSEASNSSRCSQSSMMRNSVPCNPLKTSSSRPEPMASFGALSSF